MNFEYYYGTQADQFSFIRIPRILLLDKAFSALSLSAKVLYSVLLDRMGLSMKNKWLDEENKVYIIYQITEIQSDLGFSKKKAMDYLTELEKIGLIEKKKRGFGLPNIIYVKSFMAHQSSQRSNEMGTSQEKDVVHRSIEMGTPEVMNKHLRGILVYSFCCRTVVGIQVFVCHKVNVRTQQIAIQFCKYFFFICK